MVGIFSLFFRKVILMEIVIIVLFSLSTLFFILSFFKKDRTKELQEELEHFTMTTMQEIYQLKKKIQILEEELLANANNEFFTEQRSSKQELFNEVISYYNQGYSVDEIAQFTSLSENEVIGIISSYERNNA